MRRLCVPLLLLAAACGGEEAPVVPDGNPGGQVYTLTWGPIEVPAGVEDTRCMTVRLGNDIPVKIHQIHNTLGGGSHHFIVYRVSDDTEEIPTPEPCFPFVDTLDPTAGAPLMITQRAEEDLVLPEGVAFTLEPDQMIRLEMHYINATSAPLTISATSELHAMADADFQYEADFLFIGNPDIDLPPGPNEQTLGPTWFPAPSSLEDAQVFAITGHTHHLGTNVDVAIADGEGSAGEMVYQLDNFSWSEPETVFHDPPVPLPQGGGFRFNCSWINDTGQRVGFGESVDDEMCFFWAYYYPSQGSKVCMHSEMYTENPIDICCPDDEVLCALIKEYFNEL